ncbi:MAG: transposase [Chloroflexi bacterium]|nr:transposase [Chloroflexota bacterium]
MEKLPKFDIPGHVHFVTSNVYRRIPLFVTYDYCKILLENIDHYRQVHKFSLFGYVIMPDHFHALILSEEDVFIRRIMQDIKKYTAKQIREHLEQNPQSWDDFGGLVIPKANLEKACKTPARRCLQNFRIPIIDEFLVSVPRTKRQKHQFWQTSFYDFNVYSEAKLHEKLNYIHQNPVSWSLVDDPANYVYSSYLNYCGDGQEELPIDVDWL